ncbi:MAG TPA: 4-hydroxy-tetrahydrodipicolinate reductase, partial [Kofleriaceae bacterium]|nr:4-hydroxy-tetrahydrodipicolinate reductase [Kofleriaceae bacterium]
MLRLCVLGASGRMGQQVIELARAAADIALVGAADRADSALVGAEVAPGVRVTADIDEALRGADVYVDFTSAAATAEAARAAAARGLAAVVGTTGLDAAAEAAVDALAAAAPVLQAPNFSLGVNLMLALAEQAARALGPDYDLEIVEVHHNKKRDAPSGTAIALGKALAAGRGLDWEQARRYARDGIVGERHADEIGVLAVRGGDAAGADGGAGCGLGRLRGGEVDVDLAAAQAGGGVGGDRD